MNSLPCAVDSPLPEIVIDTFPAWVLFGQHSPLYAAYRYIEDAVDDLTHIKATRSSAVFRRRDPILDIIPLAVS